MAKLEGITIRHERSCPAYSGRPVKGESDADKRVRLEKARAARCACRPTFQVHPF